MEEYLNYRGKLGYSIQGTKSHLRLFDRYLIEKGVRGKLQPLFFLEMRTALKMEPRTVNLTITAARVFFQYLVRREYYPDNPVKDIPYLAEWTSIPFIFSENETDYLLAGVIKRIRHKEKYFLKDFSQYMSIMLMARCGLRISETRRLLRHQYRLDEKTLYIEKTKFKKDRLIPLPRQAGQEMDNYLPVRDALAPAENPFLLAGLDQRGLYNCGILRMFRCAVRDIGLDQQRQRVATMIISPPIPHSLRHSFAVNILKQVKERGVSAQNALPILAVYMGHSEYKHTLKYLKLADAEHHRQLTQFIATKKAGP